MYKKKFSIFYSLLSTLNFWIFCKCLLAYDKWINICRITYILHNYISYIIVIFIIITYQQLLLYRSLSINTRLSMVNSTALSTLGRVQPLVAVRLPFGRRRPETVVVAATRATVTKGTNNTVTTCITAWLG